MHFDRPDTIVTTSLQWPSTPPWAFPHPKCRDLHRAHPEVIIAHERTHLLRFLYHPQRHPPLHLRLSCPLHIPTLNFHQQFALILPS